LAPGSEALGAGWRQEVLQAYHRILIGERRHVLAQITAREGSPRAHADQSAILAARSGPGQSALLDSHYYAADTNEAAMLRIITSDLLHLMATQSPTTQGA